jgi:hypothetical protein
VLVRLHTGVSQEKRKKLAKSFNFTFNYIDDVLSINNSRLGDFVDCIYPVELEIKDTNKGTSRREEELILTRRASQNRMFYALF